MRRIWFTTLTVVAGATLIAVAAASQDTRERSASFQQRQTDIDTQAPAARQQGTDIGTRPTGFGTRDDTIRDDYDGPSVVKGQPAGVKTGEYPPDFQLEPVELYPQLEDWLGEKAPKRFEDKVMLSDLVGKKPVMLFFGSYT